MGCCTSTSKETFEEWTERTERLEANVLREIGFKDDEYVAKYTQIEMDGKPFRVRTFYFGEADSGK